MWNWGSFNLSSIIRLWANLLHYKPLFLSYLKMGIMMFTLKNCYEGELVQYTRAQSRFTHPEAQWVWGKHGPHSAPLLLHMWRRQASRTNQAGNKAARSLSEQCLPLPLPLPPAVRRVTAQAGQTRYTSLLKHYFRKLELSPGDWDNTSSLSR